MRTVMIVDDEPLIRYSLSKLISTSFKELMIVAEADNGIDAVTLAKEHSPDLILMDIKMPGRSGIEASEIINQMNPKIHIIILTAYDQFDFIQSALEIGVEGYLLKPINKETIIQKITEIIHRINLIEAKEKAREALEKNVDAVISLAERDFVDQLLQKEYDLDSIQQQISFLGYQISYGYFMCILFEEQADRYYNSTIIRERARNKVEAAVSRYLPFMTKFIQASPRGNCLIYFLYDHEAAIYNQPTESRMIAGHLIHKVALTESIRIKIAIGKPYQKPQDYNKSFYGAYKLLEQLDYSELKHAEEYEPTPSAILFKYPARSVNDLKEKLLLGSLREAEVLKEEIIDSILLSDLPLMQLKEMLIQLYFDLRQLILIRSGQLEANGRTILQDIYQAVLLEEIKGIMNMQCSILINEIAAGIRQGDQALKEKIYNYMHTNYKQELTLEELAEAIGMTTQYTSKIFKELFEVNYIDYLTDLRIEESMKLLKSTNLRVKEIASAVGYEDANYFCRAFKRKLKMTPKEYREI